MLLVRCALNRNSAVVIGGAGAAPAPVALIADQRHPAVIADAVVAAGLPADRRKAAANRLGRELADYAVWRQPVDGMITGAVSIWADDFAVNQRTVAHKNLLSARKPPPNGSGLFY